MIKTVLIQIFVLLLLPVAVFGQSSYVLNGSASALGDDCYLLTPAQFTQNGTVWYTEQLDLDEPFSLEFTMNFGTLDGDGADGIVFVLQTVGTNAIGISGGGIGFQGFNPSFGIEFDTWQNTDSGDPVFDHMAFISNGVVNHNAATNLAGPVQSSSTNANVEDGQEHIVKVIWDPETYLMQAYFDCELRLEHNFNLRDLIFDGQSEVYWGFTAATGGAANNQSVCLQDNIVSVGPNVAICLGASTQLNVAGDPDAAYTWTPAIGLSDANISNPVASPEVTTTYTVTYVDLCGVPIQDSVLVEVIELQVFAPANDQITCAQPTVSINTFNNFDNGVNFQWNTSDGSIVSGMNGPTVTVNAPGSYTITVSVQNVCFASADVIITENTVAYAAEAGPNMALDCNTYSVQLAGSSDNQEAQYLWATVEGQIESGPTSTTPTVTVPGTYTLTVTNPTNGCTSEDDAVVTDNILYPVADAGPDLYLDCTLPSASPLSQNSAAGSGIAYQWALETGTPLLNGNGLSPGLTAEGTYVLTVTNNNNGCSASDTMSVFFDASSVVDLSGLFFPNIFSPNGDEVNERFGPVLMNDADFDLFTVITRYELVVYNRWGTLVFESSEETPLWTGKLGGSAPAGEGIYYYIATLESDCGIGAGIEYSGTLQLVR